MATNLRTKLGASNGPMASETCQKPKYLSIKTERGWHVPATE